MNRTEAMFTRARSEGRGAFIPFVVLGDPGPEESLAIVEVLIDSGADGLELGIPFTDPIADGPTVQAATTRALGAGVTPSIAFDLLQEIRDRAPGISIGLLAYANLVVARGAADFYQRCHEVGVDSVLVPDVPIHESKPFHSAARAHAIDPVYVLPPRARRATIQAVARASHGYTYLLARRGTTGVQGAVEPFDPARLARLRSLGAPPAVAGFGIAKPSHVRAALSAGCEGVISGSAVIDIIASGATNPNLQALRTFVRTMKGASQESTVGPASSP